MASSQPALYLSLLTVLALQINSPCCRGHSHYRGMVPNALNVPGSAGIGHWHLSGGGSVNRFGRDFKRAGYRWTQWLCEQDSDGDGETNGHELGDPCCEWSEPVGEMVAMPSRRTWRISHPGIGLFKGSPVGPGSKYPDVVALTGLPMPNCTAEFMAESLVNSSGAAAFVDAKLPNADSERFWDFYYSVPVAQGTAKDLRRIQQELDQKASSSSLFSNLGSVGSSVLLHGGQDVATIGILLEIVAFAVLNRIERRYGWGGGGSPRRHEEGSILGRALKALGFFLAAVVFTDLMSGLLHICLDNPLFNTWPIIGSAAIGFQHHHHDPGGVTRGPLWKFLREHHVGVALVLIPGLVPANKAATGACAKTCRLLRTFLVAFAALSSFMMWSHRWSHTKPTEVPSAITALQQAGILMDARHHSLHHVSYQINFSIFTGWVNPGLNALLKYCLHASSKLWICILVGTAVAPAAFVHRGMAFRVATEVYARVNVWTTKVAQRTHERTYEYKRA